MRQLNKTNMNFYKFKTKESDEYQPMMELILDTHEGCSLEKGLQNEQQVRLFLTADDIDGLIKQLTTAKAVMSKDAIAEEEQT